jgi:hypothetical protein
LQVKEVNSLAMHKVVLPGQKYDYRRWIASYGCQI